MTLRKLPTLAPLMFRANRHLSEVSIELPDGRTRMAQFLGRGKFSNVFLYSEGRGRPTVYIYTKHGDLSKDILSHVDRKNNKHIPLMQYLGPMFDGKIDVYRSQYYVTPVTRNNASASVISIIKALQTVHAEACTKFPGDIIAKNQCIDFNYHIAENVKAPKKIREALCCITESAQDWGNHYLFDDFRAKNLGLDPDGRLVFIDAMFDAEKLQRDRR